jgi:methyl-accepting chemotaxis protein
MASQSALRKPVSNFFIKKRLQLSLIYKIVAAVMISTIVCIGTLFLTYLVKYRDAGFYRVTLDQLMDISDRFEISGIILPGLLISGLVNLFIAVFIGLYASRKYAVPIYKLEQWADLLKQGKMTAKLRFREKEEFRELSSHCNALSETLRDQFLKIKRIVDQLELEPNAPAQIQGIRAILQDLQLEASPIEVHTQFNRIPTLTPTSDEAGKPKE